MVSLPFITEKTRFKGRVFATEPTKEIGRLLLTEILEDLETDAKTIAQGSISDLSNKSFIRCFLKNFPSKEEIELSLSKVVTIGFFDKMNLGSGVTVTGVSSGHSIGSSNWLVETITKKISILSCSSVLSTQSIPMERSVIFNSDIVVFAFKLREPGISPDKTMDKIMNQSVSALKQDGIVVFPISPVGFIYDLMECLDIFSEKASMSIPMYFVSPVADASLSLANVFSDWLSLNKSAKTLAACAPFKHADLKASGKLKCITSVSDIAISKIKRPSVIFASQASLKFGSSLHFLQTICNTHRDYFIFSDLFTDEINASSLSLWECKFASMPVNTILNRDQLNEIIKHSTPKKLIFTLDDCTEMTKCFSCPIENLSVMQTYSMECNDSSFYNIEIHEDLIDSLIPVYEDAEISVARLSGVLNPLENSPNFTTLQLKSLPNASKNADFDLNYKHDATSELMKLPKCFETLGCSLMNFYVSHSTFYLTLQSGSLVKIRVEGGETHVDLGVCRKRDYQIVSDALQLCLCSNNR